jgi:GNAT superfamily N-acetyltransferase
MTSDPFIVREADPCDAAMLVELRLQLDVESQFMMLEPDERSVSVAETETELARVEECPNSVILVAQADDAPEFAGYISAEGGAYRRNRHVAYLVLGVREGYAGHGIGTALIRAFQRSASGAEIHQLELTVMAHKRALPVFTGGWVFVARASGVTQCVSPASSWTN